MDCKQYREQFGWWLSGEMTAEESQRFQAHITTCSECRNELEMEKRLFRLLDEMPVPQLTDQVRPRFNNMLDEYKKKSGLAWSWRTVVNRISQLWAPQTGQRLAYAILLLLTGGAAGYMINHRSVENTNQQQITQLSMQLQEMRQNFSVALLENNSATERIRGVAYAGEMTDANKQVIQALLATLNNDPNVNVRLVTLEALIKFADEPGVRIGLVQSIENQDSPLMQAAIADAMVRLQEKRSVGSLQDLLKKKALNEMVKQRVAQCIQKLI